MSKPLPTETVIKGWNIMGNELPYYENQLEPTWRFQKPLQKSADQDELIAPTTNSTVPPPPIPVRYQKMEDRRSVSNSNFSGHFT